jgi:bifunctional non-homologous end joining protein LigD
LRAGSRCAGMATPRAPAASASARPGSDSGHGIAAYRAKRNFAITSEPEPHAAPARAKAPVFVVQKHAARRLHWDFRLEHGGVLWSWAVPKGPSLDPGDRRLAVRVEDHPLDYADFEGRIPEGQYGAGTVEIWDRGTWEPVGDPAAALRAGELKFRLEGQRLKGGFVLIRLKPRAGERRENWLLIKEHDTAEQAGAAALKEADAKPRRSGRTEPKAPVPGAVRGKLPEGQNPTARPPGRGGASRSGLVR